MINNNYLEAITEAKDLLSELLNDPDHGTLTFVGMHNLDDLTITAPQELDGLISGTVLGRWPWRMDGPHRRRGPTPTLAELCRLQGRIKRGTIHPRP